MNERRSLLKKHNHKLAYKIYYKQKVKKLKLNIFIILFLFLSLIIALGFFLKGDKYKLKHQIRENSQIAEIGNEIGNLINNKNDYVNDNYQSYRIKNENFDYFACFCSKARGENLYANELISYYSKLGVEKFIFGDNNLNGNEKLIDVLLDYVNNGKVDIYEIFDSDIGQVEFNQNIYEKYKTKCNWFLFFDFDEYLDIHFQPNISLRLQNFLPNKMFDKCEAILFNWLIYTDNDLIYYDNRTLLERFPIPNYIDKSNFVVKSIVRGGLNKTIFYPTKSNHVPDRNLIICNSEGTILERYNPFIVRPPSYKYAVLKHFTTKSAEEYVNKTRRGANRNLPYKIEDQILAYFRHNKFSQEKLKYFEEKFNQTFHKVRKRIQNA